MTARSVVEHALTVYYDGDRELARKLIANLRAETFREAAQHVRNVRQAGALLSTPVDQLLDEEAARVEEKSSRPTVDATPDKAAARERRLAQLLDTIRTHDGKWTSHSVQQIRRTTGVPAQRGTARRDLAELARRGHLTQHGASDNRYYTLRRRTGGA
ncbi:MAG: hypothetical protein HOV73_18305 [Streptomyces sp.]|nr:hypothetical protein [Streptomyces sp.]NUS76589.1 hypothetical protein [Streptomyces sp.]